MSIKIAQPYDANVVGMDLLQSVPAKVYFVDILGREDRAKYEWAQGKGVATGRMEALATGLEETLATSRHIHIPHIAIAFPHVTNVFRFGDPRCEEQETNLYNVGIAATADIAAVTAQLRPTSMMCLGEVVLLDEEMTFWSRARTVAEYLQQQVGLGLLGGFQEPAKLAQDLSKANA